MPYIPNLKERALALLASQFKDSPSGIYSNMQKFIIAMTEPFQTLEDASNQLRTQRNIYDAVGVQLDGLGEILGLPRNDGESDSDYRERLLFQPFINKSNGTPEEVIQILQFITGATKVRYIDIYPAAYEMITDGIQSMSLPNNNPEDIVLALADASPTGVQYPPIIATYGVEVPFVFGADFDLYPLVITDPNDPTQTTNLELDTGDLLYVNPALSTSNSEGGGFAEYGSPSIDTTGAGQFCEVIQYGGSVAPAP